MAQTKTEEKAAPPEKTAESPEAVEVNDAELPEAADNPAEGGGGSIDILLDAMVPMQVVLGGTNMTIREALQLRPGSVVSLDKQAGEPVDLYLRGTKFGTGSLVVVGDRLGVRVKEILQAEG